MSNRTQIISVNGFDSNSTNVTFGVPQGSVLGPTLFLLYINDIADSIKSDVRLFADDSMIYRDINSESDHHTLQSDLNTISKWCMDWSMELNTIKCRQIVITNKFKSSSFLYHLHGKAVPQTSSHDYLGVTITHDLRWNAHCANIANKSNEVLGIIHRTLKPCSKPVKKRANETLVRPKVECASEAWNPHTDQDVNKIEQVQKNDARFVCSNYDRSTSSSDFVSTLDWDTLEIRRLAQQASMFYKIRNGLVGIPFPPVVIPNPRHSGIYC